MKIKLKILFTLLVTVIFGSTTVYAQNVVVSRERGTGGVAAIDASNMSHTTTPKATTTTATATTPCTENLSDLASKASNKQVYKQYTIQANDNHNPAVNPNGVTWIQAINICSALGTGWRLPTQRELLLIWILQPEQKYMGKDYTPLDNISGRHYWSATERSSTTAWFVSGMNGGTLDANKTDQYNVRCVRDVHPIP